MSARLQLQQQQHQRPFCRAAASAAPAAPRRLAASPATTSSSTRWPAQQQLGAARTPCSRRSSGLACRASQSYGDAYDNLFRSSVFQSELVVKEFDSIMSELRQLSMMASRFVDFDLAGKEMFLDKMEEGTERYKLFMKRLELCEDPAAREYLRYTSAQMLEGGFTYQMMFEGLMQSLQQYRHWLEEERRVSADPVKHQAFLAAFRQAWSSSAMGAIDMSLLSRMADPQVVIAAQKDPEFYKAIKEISDAPTSETMRKWMDHPAIGPLVAAMWRTMAVQREKQGGL